MIDYGVPWIGRLCSEGAVRALWLTGECPGVTESERQLNLCWLHILAGDEEQARFQLSIF